MTIELTGASSKLVYRDAVADDPMQRQPIIDLAQEKLGWSPKIDLREGLGRTIEYFRSINFEDFRAPTPDY